MEPRHEGKYVGALGEFFHVSKEEKQENTAPFVPLDFLWTFCMKSVPALTILLAAKDKDRTKDGMQWSQVQENLMDHCSYHAKIHLPSGHLKWNNTVPYWESA